MSSDRIEKNILLRAPRSRVWQALTDYRQFGQWFGVNMHGPFTAGARVTGAVTMKPYENMPFEIVVERMEPESYFSWRWWPGECDANLDTSTGPTTLVEFTLEETPEGGTMLNVLETGFDQIPPGRRFSAYRANESGWEYQMKQIANYVGEAS